MRPVKLTMSAFGPYRDPETIDFALLEQHRLFVVSGVTGAGKTTIFDAICYALYGAASGEDRAAENRMLRSDFAPDSQATSVDFTFRTGSRTYRVFRQLAHRRSGNKTETGGKAELYEIAGGGTEKAVIERFTTSDVSAALERIIGLTKAQFIQIVMLPQGEFRKLLTSDTENKEEILRKIFRTGLYRRLEERYGQLSRELAVRHREAKLKLDGYLGQAQESLAAHEAAWAESGSAAASANPAEGPASTPSGSPAGKQEAWTARQVLEALGAASAKLAQRLETVRKAREERSLRIQAAESRWLAAAKLNERFRERSAKRESLTGLIRREPEMASLERRLQAAEQAGQLRPYEERAAEAAAEAKAADDSLQAKAREALAAERGLQEAEADYLREQGREPERKAAEQLLLRLRELEPVAAALTLQRREAEQAAEALATCERQLADVEASLAAAKQAEREANMRIRQLEAGVRELPEQKVAIEQLRQKLKLVQELLAGEQQLAAVAERERAQRERRTAVQADHDRLEAQWLGSQAALLAAQLVDGEPCPVCGSLAHPAIAGKGGHEPLQEDLEQARRNLLAAEKELAAAAAQAAAAKEQWRSRIEAGAEWGIASKELQEQKRLIEREGLRLKAAIKEGEERQNELDRLRASLGGLAQRADGLQQSKDQLQNRRQALTAEETAKRALYEQHRSAVPEELRESGQLQRRITEQQALLNRLTEAWRKAQQQRELAATRHAQEAARKDQLERQAAADRDKLEQARSRYLQELVRAGFADEAAYRAAKLPEAERLALRQTLENYRRDREALNLQIRELEIELEGREPADDEKLRQELEALQTEQEAALAASEQAQWRKRELERLIESVGQADREARDAEAAYADMADIYQLLKGDNVLRMSFERYILLDYMEQILQAANLRLAQLSGGQYQLQLSDRLESHGRQSGLGLDVFDAYTGQNRDVKTLSGGEKFNASLSLALGLADVIQANQGGVSIEMMFIDEGFGSLDEESLNKAIAALIDLQRTGRMIGVISHVAELKMAFPAILEVSKTKEGRSRTRIVVR